MINAIEAGVVHADVVERATLSAAVKRERARQANTMASRALAIEHLDARGVEWRAIKGVALGATVYGPDERFYVDTDLLVRPSEFGRALEILVNAGFRRTGPQRHRCEAEFAKAVMLVSPRGAPIDLHRLPVRPPLGEHIADRFFESVETVGDLMLPDARGRAVHASLSLLLGDRLPRPIQYVDAVRTADAIDRAALLEWATSLGAGRLVAAGISTAEGALDLLASGERVESLGLKETLTVRASRSRTRLLGDAVWAADMDSWRRRLKYVSYVLGSPEHTRSTRKRRSKLTNAVLNRRQEAPRVEFHVTNGRHHARLIEGVIGELSGRGSVTTVVSHCEFRGERTPAFDLPPNDLIQVFPGAIRRLRAERVPTGSVEPSTGGADRLRSAVARWLEIRVSLRWMRRRPHVICVLNDSAFPLDRVVTLAKRRRRSIPTVLLQEGIRFESGASIGAPAYGSAASHGVLAWGEASAEHFAQVRDGAADVRAVGHPFLNPTAARTTRGDLSPRRLLICSNPLVAFGLADESEQQDRLRSFVRACGAHNIEVALRPHPQEDGAWFTGLASEFGARVETVRPLTELLAEFPAVAVFASTVGIEALAAGCRLGVIELPRGGFAFDYVAAGAGTALGAPDFSGLEDLLGADPGWETRRAQYLERHLGPRDASARAASRLLEVAGESIRRR